MIHDVTLGAGLFDDGRCGFRVWAPRARRVAVRLENEQRRSVSLTAGEDGYFAGVVDGGAPGMRYRYVLDGGNALADPASRWQPEGVHGPSAVPDPDFQWTDAHWHGLPWSRYVIYEVHVGAFSESGTFAGAAARLDELAELGVTAVELMPVAEFPGVRNWGYDGAFPYAVESSYGGPGALKGLVNACHERGLAVILDVVYNHLGPEGNVLHHFAPYFTDHYRTPWGDAINFDGPDSDHVRRYFVENALSWIRDYHVDALRLDAVHAIHDSSAYTFLEELADAVHAESERLNRRVHLIAESDLNNPLLTQPAALGGCGLDAQWNDEFHHAVHAWLTGERAGYYRDFGEAAQITKALAGGFVYTGEYSLYRRHRHGTPGRRPDPSQLVVFMQNHDQVGNRPRGERLAALVDFETLKLAAALVLLAPSTPLVFMGEERGETKPFPYFVDHGDAALLTAVHEGRARELAGFGWSAEPLDPTIPETFERARLAAAPETSGAQEKLRRLYRTLIAQRSRMRARAPLGPPRIEAWRVDDGPLTGLRHHHVGGQTVVVFHLGDAPGGGAFPLAPGPWRKRLDTAEGAWHGNGSEVPDTFVSQGACPHPPMPRSCVIWEQHTTGGSGDDIG